MAPRDTNILGISAFYHDSAAALLRNGRIIAAVQEERFSRKKHDARFPRHAIQYCVTEAGVALSEVDYVVFYDKPLVKFERLLETYLSYAPRGFRSFLSAMPIWLKEKLFLKDLLKKELAALGKCESKDLPPLMFSEHHQSHAASAFFLSPFEEAAVLCMDGVGSGQRHPYGSEAATSSSRNGRSISRTHWDYCTRHSRTLPGSK